MSTPLSSASCRPGERRRDLFMYSGAAGNMIQKDLFDLNAADQEGFDAAAGAFGAWKEELPNYSKSLKHLCDGPDFPAECLPLAKAQGKALEELRGREQPRRKRH